jgi:hypothetical protein
MSALELIELSIAQNRIARAAHSAQLSDDLFADCDGYTADGTGEVEFWGMDFDEANEDGENPTWRVHLVIGSSRRGAW